MRSLHLLVAVVAVTSVRSVPVEEVELDKRILLDTVTGLVGGVLGGGKDGGGLLGGLLGGGGGGGGLLGGLLGGEGGLLGGDLLGGLLNTVTGVVGGLLNTVTSLLDGLLGGLAGAKTKDDVIAQFDKVPLDQLCTFCTRIPNPEHQSACQKYCQVKGYRPASSTTVHVNQGYLGAR